MDNGHSVRRPPSSVLGIILAGGRTDRRGANKALWRVQPGSPTLIETVADRLAEAGLGPALVITNTPEEYGFLGLPMVPDEVPGAGPLGGILTGLVHSPVDRIFVVGCDMPFLSPPLIGHMLSLPDD